MPGAFTYPAPTTTKKDSVQVIKVKSLRFADLWNNYPTDRIEHLDPSTGKDIYDNHCAINVSEALVKSGIPMDSFRNAKCTRCPRGKSCHGLRAQDMADWLRKRPFAGCPPTLEATGQDFREKLDNKNGIVFFKDYWQRSNEIGTNRRTGDHIDLWKDRTLAGTGYVGSIWRTTLGQGIPGIWSDLKLSTQVLFWEIP